jgi:arsenite methyltransferase
MRSSFLPYLVYPDTAQALRLVLPDEATDGHVESGVLQSEDGRRWPIVGSIPRFVSPPDAGPDAASTATADSFGRKWREARAVEYGSSAADRASMSEVLLHMLRADNDDTLDARLRSASAILNVGCGVAWPEALFNPSPRTLRFAIDYSLSVETALARTRQCPNVFVAQADLFKLPFRESSFDIVFSGGVVHHTPDPAAAVKNLCRYVRPGGLVGIYIYNIKPTLREFADRELRKTTTHMSYDECRTLSVQLSLLGKALQAYREPLEIEVDVPLLGIRKGSYDLQKFIYDHFLKCFYNEGQGLDLSVLTNLDWYHPAYASHHSKEEVFSWMEAAGMHDMRSTNPPGWEHSSNFITALRT